MVRGFGGREARERLELRDRLGYWPHIKNPRSFNEHLAHLRLRSHNPLLAALADKWAMRDYVGDRVGKHHLVPAIGVFEHAADIRWDALPNAFVVKPTHASGRVLIVRDKHALDWAAARAQAESWLRKGFGASTHEYWYTEVPPRLVVEHLLAGPDGQHPNDYKVFMFHGVPRMVQVDVGRFTRHERTLLDCTWQRLPFGYKFPAGPDVPRPASLDDMLECARRLAAGFEFMRVDFYDGPGGVPLVGELTFAPDAGRAPFHPVEYDFEVGRWWSEGRVGVAR